MKNLSWLNDQLKRLAEEKAHTTGGYFDFTGKVVAGELVHLQVVENLKPPLKRKR